MKKPMTTKALFHKIQGILTEKDKIPDILDYASPAFTPVPITTCEFGLKNNLDYGGSEGIYLDLWIQYHLDGEKHEHELGTYKTLRDDDEAMRIMARLLADFIIEEQTYVNTNSDDFTWRGVNVYPLDNTGTRYKWEYFFNDMEDAIKKKNELLETYPQVLIRNNVTREEKYYYVKPIDTLQ